MGGLSPSLSKNGCHVMKIIKLTAPDGKSVWISQDAIIKLRAPILPHDHSNTQLYLVDGEQCVQEYPEDVIDMLMGIMR